MAVLFSKVTVSADNGAKESFLCGGIPEREDNLKNWIKYQNFMKDNPDTGKVEVNVKSFVYGDGEIPKPLLGSANVIAYKQKDRKKPTLGFRAVLKTS